MFHPVTFLGERHYCLSNACCDICYTLNDL